MSLAVGNDGSLYTLEGNTNELIVSALNSSKTLVWSSTIDGISFNYNNDAGSVGTAVALEGGVVALAVDGSGNVYFSGNSNGTTDFGNGFVYSGPLNYGFLAKLDNTGTTQQVQFPGSFLQYNSIATDLDGNTFASGSVWWGGIGSANVGPGLTVTTSNFYDSFSALLVKYNY